MNGKVDMANQSSSSLTEHACTFGTNSTLVGVYTPPQARDQSAPCAIYITAGLLHHVGPTRLHVELARSLSQHNVGGFRFDLSGVGDSETSSLGGYFVDRSVSEIRQSMDFLEKQHGHRHFVLLGLCSGADDALATAQLDPRVSGVVLLNGYAYKAGFFYINRLVKYYWPRLFKWEKIRGRISRVLKKSSSAVNNKVSSAGMSDTSDKQALAALDDDYRFIPDQEHMADTLQRLTEKKTNLLFVYTGSEHDDYTYQGQFYAMFPGLRGSPHVTERYLKQADHTLVLRDDRIMITDWVIDWFDKSQFEIS